MAKNDFSIQLSADDSKLISSLNNSKQKLQHLESAFQKAGSKSKVFGSSMEGLGNQLQGLSGKFEGLLQSVGGSMEGLTGAFGSLGSGISSSVTEILGSLSGLSGGLLAVAGVAVSVISKSISEWDNLKQELNAFQNIAEASDAEMLKFSQSAKELSNQSGIATIEIIKMQQGLIGINPDLVKNTSALNTMSRAVLALSAAGRISADDAGQYLSSVLAAFNLSGEQAVSVSNKIAQSSRIGSQEINNVAQILQKSGSAFASAGVDLNMALGVIEGVGDKYLGKSEELGTALNSTLSKLMSVREEYSEYNLSLHSLNDVLESAAKNHLSYADCVELVGISNASLLQQLIQNREKFGELAAQIGGTNAALEMGEVQNSSLGKSWEKLGVVTENFWLTLSQSAPMQELYSYIQDVIDSISDLLSWFEGLCDQWNTLIGGFESSFTIWDYLKAQMQVTIAIIKSLGETFLVLGALAIRPIIDLWNTCKKFATDIWKRFSDFPLGRAVKNAVMEAWKWLQNLWQKIVAWWNSLKKSLGLKTDNSTDVKLNVKEDRTVTQTFKGGGGSGLPSLSSSKKGGKKGGSKKGGLKKTEIAPPEIGSLKFYEDKLRAINDELSKTNVSSGRLQELKMEAAVVQEMIDKIKRRNKLFDEKPKHSTQKATIEQGSIQEISDLISSKEQQIKNVRVGSDSFNLLRDEIEKLKSDKELLEIQLNPKIDENSMNSLLGSLANVQQQINSRKSLLSITSDKSQIQQLTNELEALTQKEYKIQLSIDEKRQAAIAQNADDIKSKYENLGQAAQSVGNVFTALGNVASDSFLGMVGNIAGAVSSILPEIGKLIAANEVAALSSGTASAAALPFPANLVSIATVVSTILGLFSSFSSLPKFENGGVVGGHSYHGDKILSRLNSSELVLNKGQQNRVWDLISQGTSPSPMNGASVQFKISGRDLVGVLSNHQNKTSRVL